MATTRAETVAMVAETTMEETVDIKVDNNAKVDTTKTEVDMAAEEMAAKAATTSLATKEARVATTTPSAQAATAVTAAAMEAVVAIKTEVAEVATKTVAEEAAAEAALETDPRPSQEREHQLLT